MAQKLTLAAYLEQRGKKAKALTKIEAQVFGIAYPLQAGWPRRHGAMEITETMIDRVKAQTAVASESDERKIRRGAKRATTVVSKAATATQPRAATGSDAPFHRAAHVKLPQFPGFILGATKRRRARPSAPSRKKARSRLDI